MNIQKLLIGAVLGAVLYYLLGWLVYGHLLQGYFSANTGKAGHSIFRPLSDYQVLYRVLGYLSQGVLLVLVIQWSNSRTVLKGAVTGGLLGGLMELSFDCQTYATTYVISKHGLMGNVLAFTLISAVAGALVALAAGGEKERSH